MRLVLFAPQGSDTAGGLNRLVGRLVPARDIIACDTIESLEYNLRTPSNRPALAIFMPSSFENLMELVDLGWMLQDCRTIVILPDRDNSTVTMGHLLRPSFLTFKDCDINEVGAVLTNIMHNTAALTSLAPFESSTEQSSFINAK